MAHIESKPIGGKIVTKSFLVVGVFAALGLFFILKRFIFGLGAVTNMNDGYPWGIFIAYDVVVGTALACGGYAMALMIYIFNKGEFTPLLRPALLASVFGYTLAGISVIFDVGRWWQVYNIFLPGRAQLNSVLFEVALCIGLYIFVLWIEFTPSFLEKMKAKGYLKTVNRIIFFFIALGVLLPTMHQSSLGTLMVIAGPKVSPLWHTPALPVLFLSSAIAMGWGIVIWEGIFSSRSFKRPLEMDILPKVGKLLPPIILVFLVVRFADLVIRGHLGTAFQLNMQSFFFWFENALYVTAIVLLWSEAKRNRAQNLWIGASALLFAGAGTRFNAFLVAYTPATPGWNYFPSFSELSITLGLIAIEVMAYMVLVKKLPVLPAVHTTR